jgi:hypothetical protein
MNRIAVALVGLTFSTLSAEIFAAESGASRGFGQFKASQPAASLSTTRGLHSSFRGHRLHPNVPGRPIHPHFDGHKHRLRNKLFVPHPHLAHHLFLRHPGFFFGHRVIGFAPSSVVIWSNPDVMRGFSVPSTERDINEGTPPERPLISIMLHHRRDLGLSPRQVHELEGIRDTYQRNAIRYDADLRIAEMEIQRLLKADPVDLELVRVELEGVERLKVELRLARLRAIEQGKALLSPQQREKLSALLGEDQYSRLGEEYFSEPMQEQP